MAATTPPRPLPAWVRHAGGDPAALAGLPGRDPAPLAGLPGRDPAPLRDLADRDLLGALDHGAGGILAATAALQRQLCADRSLHALAGGIEALAAQVEATTRAARLMQGEILRLAGPAALQVEILHRLDRAAAAAEALADDTACLLDRLGESAP